MKAVISASARVPTQHAEACATGMHSRAARYELCGEICDMKPVISPEGRRQECRRCTLKRAPRV